VVLGLMRDGPGAAERPPTPGLAELEALIGSVRAAGTPVELRLLGTDRVLPAHVQLTIYRIVQEALTNVVKHAPGAATTVDVAVSAGEARIEVSDIPSGPPRAVGDAGAGAGYGTTGMYERAAAFGGSLRAEPLPGGGFRVLAHLPVGQWP
jgi:signal transduction histidine kinase